MTSIHSLSPDDVILSGHDISDGGLIVCLLEMAIAGGRGLDLSWTSSDVTAADVTADVRAAGDPVAALLAEEPGWVLQVAEAEVERVLGLFSAADVPCRSLGVVTEETRVAVRLDGDLVLDTSLEQVTRDWEETSYRLELLQVSSSDQRSGRLFNPR